MNKQHILTLTLSVIAVAFLTACGATKSNELSDTTSRVEISSQQSLATCNRSTSESLGFNLASVLDSTTGQINPDWIKLKFNFISTDITQTGYSFKFFKWRVVGGSAQLDSSPLTFNAYLLSNGQPASESMTSVFTTQINQQHGFYLRLNDDAQNPYQVLKVVAYKADGTIAAQSDILIPQFLASPIAYKTNSDGTTRVENLQKLHPLYATDVTNWTQTQLSQNFDQYCF